MSDITRLGYTRANPKLAFGRVTPSGVSSDIYKTQDNQEWVVASNFSISFEGINWGEPQLLPGPTPSVRPAIIADYAFDPGSGRRIYVGGDVSSQNPSAVGPDPHWTGNYPIYAVLARGDIIINGETVATDVKAVHLIEGWQDMGNDGQDIKAIRDLLDLGLVTPFPEMEITITDIRAIFRMFDNVDGYTEEKGGSIEVYNHDWATEPGDDWSNSFEGNGFGIDVLGGMKASHANPGYTIGVNGFAGSFASRLIENGEATGYEQVNRTYFTGSPNPMLDLRINSSGAVLNGGKLRIGYNNNVIFEVVGGNSYYGYDYGTGSEDLSQLKTQLVNILSAASQPGEPLNGLLTMVSPSSDNLPNYVQIHLEASNLSVWVESGDSIVQRQWIYEFDYDVSNTISLFSKAGGPPACPLLIVQAINLEGLSGGPMLDGLCVGFILAKGNDGIEAYGFNFGGDGPATSGASVPDTGRIMIQHDGNGNYSWSISTDGGQNYTPLWTNVYSELPNGWQFANRRLRFGVATFGLGNTPDGRIGAVRLNEPGSSYMANAFRPLQNGSNGWGYLIDRLGFDRDGVEYKGLFGQPPTIITFDGSLAFKDRGGGDLRAFLQQQGHATEAYYVSGDHTIHPEEIFATGEQDIYALLGSATIDNVDYHLCLLGRDDERQAIRDFWSQQVGGVIDEEIKVWQANGINEDYTYVGPGYTPPVPDEGADTRWARQRSHFENGAVDESWNELLDSPFEGKEAGTVHKEVKKQ